MITQFTIGFSRTINLGNFESCRVEASVTFVIPEEADGATYNSERELAQQELRYLLEQTYKAQYQKRQERNAAA